MAGAQDHPDGLQSMTPVEADELCIITPSSLFERHILFSFLFASLT